MSLTVNIQVVAPCDIASITVLEHDAPRRGKTYLSEKTISIENNNRRILLSDDDIKKLHHQQVITTYYSKLKISIFLLPLKSLA